MLKLFHRFSPHFHLFSFFQFRFHSIDFFNQSFLSVFFCSSILPFVSYVLICKDEIPMIRSESFVCPFLPLSSPPRLNAIKYSLHAVLIKAQKSAQQLFTVHSKPVMFKFDIFSKGNGTETTDFSDQASMLANFQFDIIYDELDAIRYYSATPFFLAQINGFVSVPLSKKC